MLPNRLLATAAVVVLPLVAACSPGGDSYTDRMAAEHAGDSPEPAAAAAGEPSSDVVGEQVVYATVDGSEVTGYLARPEGAAEGVPGLIVIHEWWGLNDNVETMARRFADLGYAALAVDLYGGETADDPDGARALMQSVIDEPGPAEDNLRQAYAYLGERLGAPSIGVVGWCFGGGWSLQSALMLPELDAAVIYYGRLVTDRDQLATLDTPILGLFGAEDQGIPVDQVREFEAALAELGKPHTIEIYDGAGHAFANPSGTRYQPQAAEDAWEKTKAFLAEHLG